MSDQTLVATANVLCDLPRRQAGAALAAVLESAPDLVGLQEWGVSRIGLLRRSGRVRLVPSPGPWLPRRGSRSSPDYLWCAPVFGGCVVGARADRYRLLGVGSRFLSRVGRADNPARRLGFEPPRMLMTGVFADERSGGVVSLVCFHLAPGVQARGRYRDDRPVLVGRHREEARRLQAVVDQQLALGRTVFAVGDSNFDGFRLAGLESAWAGREAEPGTLGGRRKIDDVHGPGPAEAVTTVITPSDHKAVLVRRTT